MCARSDSSARRPRMRLRVRGDADREVAELANEAVRDRPRARARRVGGRDPSADRHRGRGCSRFRRRVAGDDLDELGPCVRGAGEVRHRRHRRVAVDLDDEIVGALARGPTGAVRDRDVGGLERLQAAERAREHLLGFVVAGREELERVARCALQVLVDPHGPRSVLAHDRRAHGRKTADARGHGDFKRLGARHRHRRSRHDPLGHRDDHEEGQPGGFTERVRRARARCRQAERNPEERPRRSPFMNRRRTGYGSNARRDGYIAACSRSSRSRITRASARRSEVSLMSRIAQG